MNTQAGHGASVHIEACGKTFTDGTRALEPATGPLRGPRALSEPPRT